MREEGNGEERDSGISDRGGLVPTQLGVARVDPVARHAA